MTFATEVAQEIKTKDDEDKSPLITKTLPRTPTTTVQELITTAAAQSKYYVVVFPAAYQNKVKDDPFKEMRKWWEGSTFKDRGYAYAFLDTENESLDDIYATAVSYNVEMRVAGTLETAKSHADATKKQYRVALFSPETKKRLEATGDSKGNYRAIIWTDDGVTQEAASDFFKEYLLNNPSQHIYSPSTSKGFIAYRYRAGTDRPIHFQKE